MLHNFRACRLHLLECYKQSYRGPQTTHRDRFGSANVVQLPGIHCFELRDGLCIFLLCGRLIFVVIQIRARYNQDFFTGGRDNATDPRTDGFQIFQSKRAQRDWHNLNVWLQQLQERQLNFERMFLFVRACIFDKV